MNGQFLQDLTIVMLVAGLVMLLFRWLRQPVVLGYLLAGFIIGPYTPPFPLIHDEQTIRTLADIGVVFLMFSLGLDFSFKKLKSVGIPALVTASFEIMAMIVVGFTLGQIFHWTRMESVFLGIMLALTSTTIVVKSLRDAGALKSSHGTLISGVSIFDDIFVIFVMILLPSFAVSGELPAGAAAATLFRLGIFLVASVVLGLLLVPRFLRFIGRIGSDEMLLIIVLALCLGVALLTVKVGYSVALGAFMIGAMVAESRELGRIVRLTAPLRDMFSAVFFVAIGMLIDPVFLWDYRVPVLVITLVYVIAKVSACAIGAMMAGFDGHTAMRVGTGMAQVGEFAFILATLGVSMGVIGTHLYPVIVAVATLNAFIRPYLTGNADRFSDLLMRRLPAPMVAAERLYTRWIQQLKWNRTSSPGMRRVRSVMWQIALNAALIAAVFISVAVVINRVHPQLPWLPSWTGGARTLGWLSAALLALPIYVATIHKMQAVAMMLSELALAGVRARDVALRAFLSNALFIVQLLGLALMTFLLSLAIMPPLYVLAVLLVALAALVFVRGRSLNAWYSRAKFAVVETWTQPPIEPASEEEHPMPALLREAKMHTFVLKPNSAAIGHLIRELGLRAETGASIIAIERGGRTLVNPSPDDELKEGDAVLLLGSDQQLAQARTHLQRTREMPASES
ncbi:MAG: cation:proton antiporter [Kiritimatiellae bacterium]|nr:cation:proton antiporter [Kiritimatiellia bacterium]MCO5068111.1 cation:proton antiporter [Kiritimatiellia bacterium]